jgi:hypothetical protein
MSPEERMLYIISLVIKGMKNVGVRAGYISSRSTAKEIVKSYVFFAVRT